jgi:hypothetical protein
VSVFVTNSDPLVAFAVGSSVVAGAATVVLFGWVVFLRWRLIASRRREADFIARWREPLARVALTCGDGDAPTDIGMPVLEPSDRNFFLHEWNVIHDCLRGEATIGLNRLGFELEIDRIAWRMLHRGRLGEKLLAIATLGHLRDVEAWDAIAAHLNADNTLISLMAAKALTNIDAERAVPMIIPLITARNDWAAARVASLLREAGPEATSRRLARAILNGTLDEAEILIQYLPTVYRSVATDVVHEMLRRPVDDRVTAVCLRVVDNPLELPLVRSLTRHPRWHIRMRAAVVLGRMGYRQDKKYLIRLLSDTEWWVRYRSAQALSRLPFVGRAQLLRIRNSIDDRFGRDMLDQVLAEAAG